MSQAGREPGPGEYAVQWTRATSESTYLGMEGVREGTNATTAAAVDLVNRE